MKRVRILKIASGVVQNKNGYLKTFLVNIFNTANMNANERNLHYFESNHSVMPADQYQVELSTKRTKSIYDFLTLKNLLQVQIVAMMML